MMWSFSIGRGRVRCQGLSHDQIYDCGGVGNNNTTNGASFTNFYHFYQH